MRNIIIGLLLLFLCMSGIETARSEDILKGVAGGEKPIGRATEPRTYRRIDLMGSRGEVLNFLVKLRARGCSELKFSGFRAAGAAGPSSFNLRLYEMGSIFILKPSFPSAVVGNNYDPLLPSGSKVCAKRNKSSWYWGEVEIPADAAPGSYRGVLRFKKMKLPVRLTVWRMVMPEKPSFPGYGELTSVYIDLGHFGKYRGGDPALHAAYVQELQAHRMYPIKSWMEWPLKQDGSIDIFSFPDPSRALHPATVFPRPLGIYFDFPAIPYTAWNAPIVESYYTGIQQVLPQIGRPGEAMVFLWDEPREYDLPLLKQYAARVKQLAPDVKIMVTVPGFPELADYVDIFVPAPDYFGRYASLDDYRHLQETGHEVWWYISCMSHGCTSPWNGGTPDMTIERPAAYVRSISWLAAKYNITGFFYYSVNNGYRLYPQRDPWDDLNDFTGNGDGTLLYPGRPGERGFTEHTPVASIRLKLWREASYDAEYIRWMKSLSNPPAWWQRSFDKLVKAPKTWSKKYGNYQSLRNKAGAYLNQVLGD